MAASYTEYPTIPVMQRGFSWSGMFAGTFLFLAIEATFGILGIAILASARNSNLTNPVGPGINTGVGIWMVVLSIISLYWAGNLASRISGATTRNAGMYSGLVTFGMCIFTTILATSFVLGSTVARTTGITASTTSLLAILTTGGYWLFAVLVLAMIAAEP